MDLILVLLIVIGLVLGMVQTALIGKLSSIYRSLNMLEYLSG